MVVNTEYQNKHGGLLAAINPDWYKYLLVVPRPHDVLFCVISGKCFQWLYDVTFCCWQPLDVELHYMQGQTYGLKAQVSALRGVLTALWPGSVRIRYAGGIFGFPRLVYSPRYSRGRQQGCRLPSAYLGYTLRMKTLFRDWPDMVHDTRTRRRRRLFSVCRDGLCVKELTVSAQITEVNFDVTSWL